MPTDAPREVPYLHLRTRATRLDSIAVDITVACPVLNASVLDWYAGHLRAAAHPTMALAAHGGATEEWWVA